LLEWLGLAPSAVAAKGLSEGTHRQAVFGPDGQRLYLFGTTSEMLANGDLITRGLGLRLVDLTRGALVGEALADEQISHLLPAPDGRHVYAFGPIQPASMVAEGDPRRLRRLDATTLAVLAEREVTVSGWPALRLRPAVTGDG
jgi:hypothetical protein